MGNERDRMNQYEQGQREQDEANDPANHWPYTSNRVVCVKCGKTVRIDTHKCTS